MIITNFPVEREMWFYRNNWMIMGKGALGLLLKMEFFEKEK